MCYVTPGKGLTLVVCNKLHHSAIIPEQGASKIVKNIAWRRYVEN